MSLNFFFTSSLLWKIKLIIKKRKTLWWSSWQQLFCCIVGFVESTIIVLVAFVSLECCLMKFHFVSHSHTFYLSCFFFSLMRFFLNSNPERACAQVRAWIVGKTSKLIKGIWCSFIHRDIHAFSFQKLKVSKSFVELELSNFKKLERETRKKAVFLHNFLFF